MTIGLEINTNVKIQRQVVQIFNTSFGTVNLDAKFSQEFGWGAISIGSLNNTNI